MSAITTHMRPLDAPLTGLWVTEALVRHFCKPPAMPEGVPAGLIYRCRDCRIEWTWEPAKSIEEEGQARLAAAAAEYYGRTA